MFKEIEVHNVQYIIYIDGKVKDRIDPVNIETIENSFEAYCVKVGNIQRHNDYVSRNIYLSTK